MHVLYNDKMDLPYISEIPCTLVGAKRRSRFSGAAGNFKYLTPLSMSI